MIQRNINLSKTHSFFLFGARGAGKTTLLERVFSPNDSLFLSLLEPDLYDQFLLEPARFRQMINQPENSKKRVIVDEVQKLPRLLDLVHLEIQKTTTQKTKRQFILTGSSARKLKQSGSNLLAGRAWIYNLYPLSSLELAEKFDLKTALEFGGLPEPYLAAIGDATEATQKKVFRQEAVEFLNAYVGTYLQKEIQEEGWVKNLAPFRKFLSVAAQMNGQIINKSNIARDVGIHDVTIANYFEILEDTLLGFLLPAFDLSVRKAQRKAPKFYFIDTGIKRALDRTLRVELLPQTSAFGDAFEHWVVLELLKNSSYRRLDWEFSYLRSKDDVEIDLVIDRPGQPRLLVEIKSTEKIMDSDAKALESLGRDLDPKADRWLLSQDQIERKIGGTRALHWQKALEELFG